MNATSFVHAGIRHESAKLVAGAGVMVAGVPIAGGWRMWENRRNRHAISEIESEMAAGRHAIAAHGLTQLLARNHDSDQAAYLLGVCEQARAIAGRRGSLVPSHTGLLVLIARDRGSPVAVH